MITVDSREPEHMRDALRTVISPDLLENKMLRTGDFCFQDRCGCTVGIERKTVGDLLGSLADGRLSLQLTRLRDEFDVPILLIDGLYSIDKQDMTIRLSHWKTGWKHAAVQMALLSVQGDGIYVIFTPSIMGTADTIRVLYGRGQKKCLRFRYDRSRVSGVAVTAGLDNVDGSTGPALPPNERMVLGKSQRPYAPARGDSVGQEPPRYTLSGPKVQSRPSRSKRVSGEAPVHRDGASDDDRDGAECGLSLADRREGYRPTGTSLAPGRLSTELAMAATRT